MHPWSSGAVAAVLVAGASVVVAMTATDVGLLMPAAQLGDGALLATRVIGGMAAAAGLMVLLRQRGPIRSNAERRYDPAATAMLAALTIMVVLYAMALLAPRYERASNPLTDRIAGEGTKPMEEAEPPRSEGLPPTGFLTGDMGRQAVAGNDRRTPVEDEEETGWQGSLPVPQAMARAVLGALLIGLAVAALVVLLRRTRPDEVPSAMEESIDAVEVEHGIEASLIDVAGESGDPRAQVIAAYHSLLAALASAGAPRRPHEAPHEHLYRVMSRLGVEPAPMHGLTALYVAALFDRRPLTEEHRAAAESALVSALDNLRATEPVHG